MEDITFEQSPENTVPTLEEYIPDYTNVEDDEFDLEQIPSCAFFEHYVHQDAPALEQTVPPATLIVERAAEHLSRYVHANPQDMFSHLCKLYNMFHLDEEIFLTAIITLYRYMGALGQKLVLSNASELFYLLVLCLLISMKGLLDHPYTNSSVAREFGLDASRLAFNEHQILVSLQYSLFFTADDLYASPEEMALSAAEVTDNIRRRHRGSLTDIFPEEGFLCLSYSKQKPKRPSILIAWREQQKPRLPPPLPVYYPEPMIESPPPSATSISPDPSAESALLTVPPEKIQAPVVAADSAPVAAGKVYPTQRASHEPSVPSLPPPSTDAPPPRTGGGLPPSKLHPKHSIVFSLTANPRTSQVSVSMKSGSRRVKHLPPPPPVVAVPATQSIGAAGLAAITTAASAALSVTRAFSSLACASVAPQAQAPSRESRRHREDAIRA